MTEKRQRSDHDIDGLYSVEKPIDRQRDAFLSESVPDAVYGLGKMRLSLAAVFTETTGNVVGADIDPDVVATVNNGACHVKQGPKLPSLVDETVSKGALTATTNPQNAAAHESVHVVIVPTLITDAMPAFTAERLCDHLESEGTPLSVMTVVVLGLTYRPGVEESRASPAIEIADRLSASGASVYGVDPLLESFEAFDLEPISLEEVYDLSVDGVVVVTPHEEFDRIRWNKFERTDGGWTVVIDGRASVEGTTGSQRVYEIGGGTHE